MGKRNHRARNSPFWREFAFSIQCESAFALWRERGKFNKVNIEEMCTNKTTATLWGGVNLHFQRDVDLHFNVNSEKRSTLRKCVKRHYFI